MMRECEVCGVLFQTLARWKGVRTCSTRCRVALWRSDPANRQAELDRARARRELRRSQGRPLLEVLDARNG